MLHHQQAPSAGYGLAYDVDVLRAQMRRHYDKIIAFITDGPFRRLLEEMSELPPGERPAFVQEVLLDDGELERRGVTVPDGILIQRSAFGDRRPTLFAVKHFLPDGFRDVWENVNITFDNRYLDEAVSRARDNCWRAPLEPARQAAAMAKGDALEVL